MSDANNPGKATVEITSDYGFKFGTRALDPRETILVFLHVPGEVSFVIFSGPHSSIHQAMKVRDKLLAVLA